MIGIGIIVLLGIVVIAVVLVISAAVSVPTAHYGVITRFGERVRDSLSEGLSFIIPFIEKVLIYSIELKTDPLDKISVFSSDRLDIELKGSVQWRPDTDNLKKFVEIPENTILVGLKDAIKSEIGKIAGEKKGDFFIKERKALEMLINCIFRLQRPPHYFLNPKSGTSGKEYEFGDSFNKWIGEKQMGEKLDKLISAKTKNKDNGGWNLETVEEEVGEDDKKTGKFRLDIIAFYKVNARLVQLMIDLGETERSPIEELYHIDISIFRLADVDFTEATKKALEKKRQVEAEIVAAKQQQTWKLEIIDDLMKKGLDAEKANNAADVILGIAEKRQVISIEGGGSVIPLINVGKGGK